LSRRHSSPHHEKYIISRGLVPAIDKPAEFAMAIAADRVGAKEVVKEWGGGAAVIFSVIPGRAKGPNPESRAKTPNLHLDSATRPSGRSGMMGPVNN
jgi:hypothetical protein